MPRTLLPLVAVAALTLLTTACEAPTENDAVDPGDAVGELEGTFLIEAGGCDDGSVETGSSFRMVQPGGDPDQGPFMENADSPCGDTTWTPLRAGEDGGLVLGEHQPMPDDPFDDEGHGRASAILQPQAFFAVEFAVATEAEDRQSGEADVPAPSLEADAEGAVSGQLTAWGVAWNEQFFNQGAPKPDGELPGGTTEPTGSYDADTGELTVEWASEIVGGPFDGFTGLWRLEGELSS